MTITRRTLLGSSLVAGASLVSGQGAAQPPGVPAPGLSATPAAPAAQAAPAAPPGPAPAAGAPGHRVIVPNGSVLPWISRRGVKIYHLRAQPVRHQIAPGLDIEAWGYNGVTPGPVIEAVAGDRVRVYVTNQLAEPTSIHWHGILVPYGMDGVAGLTQAAIAPGKTFRYELTFDRPGTNVSS